MASGKFGVCLRKFSTSPAVRSNLVKPPIYLFGIEGRYAHALFSAATKEKKLDVVEKDLKDIQAMLKKEVKLAEIMANPTIKRNEKRDFLKSQFTKKNYSSITVNLFAAMADNGRLNKLGSILSAFDKMMSAHRGEVVCEVTTAKPLDAAYMAELKKALEAFLKKGEVLQLTTKVDPSLIGGMVVNLGDKYVDMSTSSKIKTYTNLIREAI